MKRGLPLDINEEEMRPLPGGARARSEWMGEGASDIPGPGEYDINRIDKRTWVKPAAIFGKEVQRPEPLFEGIVEAMQKPGPGEYHPDPKWDTAGTIFSKSLRPSIENR